MSKAYRRRRKRAKRIELTEQEAEEFLRLVRDDLDFLRQLDYRSPTRTTVRIASSILRRLLADGMYQNAWKLAGFDAEPRIRAIDLEAVVEKVDRRYIHYAYAGGANTEGAHHTGYALLVVPKSEAEVEGHEDAAKRLSSLLKPGVEREFLLTEFCTSAAVISGSAGVSRLGIVRYVANKLGGVHWDNRRGAWSDPVGSRHRLLDEGHLVVGRLPAALYELLSISQCLATSEDTSRFIEKVVEIAPESEEALNVIKFREGRSGKYTDLTFNNSSESAEKRGR